jgi:RHS repeat-associated protein
MLFLNSFRHAISKASMVALTITIVLFALPCHAQQECATITPTSVSIPAGGGHSADITIKTTTPTGQNNCGKYAAAAFELAFVSCTNCNGIELQVVSISQGPNPPGNWIFVYQLYNTDANLSCVPSTYLYEDGAAGQIVTATQNSSCQGIAPPGRGPAGTPNNPQAPGGEPVSTGTGDYYYRHTDLTFFDYNPSLPFVFERSYNSLDTRSGPLGKGWTHNYNITVHPISTGVVGVQWGDGHSETYTLTGGRYVPSPGATNTLTGAPATGNCTLTTKTGVQYLFSAGLLTAIRDPNGRALTVVRGANNSFYQILYDPGPSGNSGQQQLSFYYDSTTSRITQITDGAGRTVSYGYNSGGDLISYTDPAGNVTEYAYTSSGPLASITLANKNVLLRNTYDASGRVISQTNARGYTTTFSYNTPATAQTTITDPLGHKTIHTYDSAMRIARITDALGHASSYTYDSHNNLASITDARGNTSKLTYDSLGNMLTYTDPLGNKASFSYNSFSAPLTITTPKGNTTTLKYDEKGNLTTVQDPAGNQSSFNYSSSGQLISSTDARGNVTTFSYSADIPLAPTGVTDALHNQTTLTYDVTTGRLTSIADPKKDASTIAYDLLNRVISLTDPLGNTTHFGHDVVGNLTNVIDANGNATAYAYDPVGNVTQVTDALGHDSKYVYDPNNNRLSFINANDKVTGYAYDNVNRLVKVTDPLDFYTTYGLDADGNVITLTDANGKKSIYKYDANNRLTDVSYADGSSLKYKYDANGNRRSMSDLHGTTDYAYDHLDRVTSIGLPGGAVVDYTYDAVGHRDTLTYPDKEVLKFSYDAGNRLSALTDWKNRKIAYSYDPASNLTGIAFPNTTTTALTYDAANRLTGISDSANSVAYRVLAYALDNVGNRTTVKDGAVVTNYSYDVLNELLTAQSGASKSSWTYDAAGNRVKQVSSSGTTNYTYDADDRMLTAGASAFTYDKNGNRIRETTASGETAYAYDPNNRLLSVAATTGTTTFAYDGDGNRISQTTPSGTYDYVNDTAVGLPVVLNEKGPDGAIDYAYGSGLLESLSSAFNYFYDLDGLDSVINLTNASGQVQEAYSYGAWGNALIATGSAGTKNKSRFTAQALDPATGLYYLRARYFDQTSGRLLSKDPFAGFAGLSLTTHRYIYAGNNPVRFIDPSGRFYGGDDVGFLIGGAISGIIGQASSDWLKGETSGFWVYVGQASAGALTGFYVGNCVELVVCAAIQGGAGGVLGYAEGAASKGEPFSPCQAITAAFSGVVGGGGAAAVGLPTAALGLAATVATSIVSGALGSLLDVGSQASAGCLNKPSDSNAPEGEPQSK